MVADQPSSFHCSSCNAFKVKAGPEKVDREITCRWHHSSAARGIWSSSISCCGRRGASRSGERASQTIKLKRPLPCRRWGMSDPSFRAPARARRRFPCTELGTEESMTLKMAHSVGNRTAPTDEASTVVRANGASLVNSLRRPRFTTEYGITHAVRPWTAFGCRPCPSIRRSRVNKARQCKGET